jgi:hypothetical protein
VLELQVDSARQSQKKAQSDGDDSESKKAAQTYANHLVKLESRLR